MYYLVINGSQAGPYPVGKIQEMLAAREIPAGTLAWTNGQADWQPVEKLIAPPVMPPPPPTAKPVPPIRKPGLGKVGMTLAIFGAVFLGLLVILGGVIGYMVYLGNGLDKSSKEYVDAAIPAIVTGWSPDELVKRESKTFLKVTNDQQLVRLFATFRKLGALKTYEGAKGDANINYTPDSGKVITATYIGQAKFDNGDAQIKVILIQENGVWKIQGFRIDSPVFLSN